MNLTINIENGVVSIFSDKDVKQLRQIQARLDRMETQLETIKILLTPFRYIPPELERAIVRVQRSVNLIDRKVPDLDQDIE